MERHDFRNVPERRLSVLPVRACAEISLNAWCQVCVTMFVNVTQLTFVLCAYSFLPTQVYDTYRSIRRYPDVGLN
jgi:hypothetical protein